VAAALEDEPEDCKEPPTPIKKEEEFPVKKEEDVADDLHQDKDEREECKKSPAAIKKEEEDEVGQEYSPGEIDGKSNWGQLATREEHDDEATYLPDMNTVTKPLLPLELPSGTDTRVKTASSPAMTLAEPNSGKPVAIGHAATPVPIVQANSALATHPADEKPAVPGRGNVCIENKTVSKGTDQSGGTRKEDTSTINTRQYPKRSRMSANIVKRKYSLRSLSQQNNKKSAGSKPLRKDKGFSTSLGEVNRSPMASSDEDEFGRGIESAVDGESDTSDSVDGIIDQDEAILDRYDAKWNRMYKRLRAFKEDHGHCELFWAVDRFIIILNTPTNTPPVSP
jgi:hypothetical protein